MGLQGTSGVTTRAAAAAAAAAAAGLGHMELDAHEEGRRASSGVRGGNGGQAQTKRSKDAWTEETMVSGALCAWE